MRKLLLTALLLLGTPALAELRVLACEPEWAAVAEAVGGDHVRVQSATAPGQDAHRVQARPALIAAVRSADLVFCTGAGLETGWLPTLLNRGGNPDVRQAPGLLLAAEQVALLDKPEVLDRSQGDMHAAGNPHVHLDPRRVATIAGVLADRLATLDPDHAEHYRKAAGDFARELEQLAGELSGQAGALNGMPVVVHHRTWRYLLDWLGMTRVAELEPKPGLPPTPGHLSSLVQRVGATGAGLILYRDINGDDAAQWLAARTGACAVKLPFTVGEQDLESLVALYRSQVETLLAAAEQCHGER